MKRKSEVIHQIEPKICLVSPFKNEEILDVNDIDKDVDDFLDCYNKFVKYVTEVYDKKEKTSAAKASHFILKFKELNRKAQFRLSISREKTKETKNAINKNHLTMQNLLYEALHLEKETNACLEYKSLFDEIELKSLDLFNESAPSNLKNAATDHELTLNRLHWELCERMSLSTQIEEAEREEQRLLEEIKKKNESYSSISTHLKCVFESTQSLEDIFEMPMHHQDEQNALSESLPEPLYVLYTHLRVHASIDEKNMQVNIVRENDREAVLVKLDDDKIQLSLLFQWDCGLELITVLPIVDPSITEGLSALTRSLLDPEILLSELPGDHGSPMDAAWVRCKVTDGSQPPSKSRGIPYLWCQRLSGTFSDISVPNHNAVTTTIPEYGQLATSPRVPLSRPLSRVIDDIRARIHSRVQLASEVSILASPAFAKSPGLSCQWSLGSFADFKASADSSLFVSSGLASGQCFYYRGLVGSTKCPGTSVPLWLVVPYNYPDRDCVVVLDKTDVAATDDLYRRALHLVEVEVNCYCQELSPGNVLSGQLSRLLAAIVTLIDHRHNGPLHSPLAAMFVGGKFPATKRPFMSL